MMLAAIFFVYVITYMPGFFVKTVKIPNNAWICSQVDRCYTHPTLHSIAYVFNWASVWINPVIYIAAQKKYQVTDTVNECRVWLSVIRDIPAASIIRVNQRNNFAWVANTGCSETPPLLQIQEGDLTKDDQDEVFQLGEHGHQQQQQLKEEHRRQRWVGGWRGNQEQGKPVTGWQVIFAFVYIRNQSLNNFMILSIDYTLKLPLIIGQVHEQIQRQGQWKAGSGYIHKLPIRNTVIGEDENRWTRN